jgi:tetratricopeptide (TPR) repeat protein
MQFLDDFDLCRLGIPGHRTWNELSQAAKDLHRRGSNDPLIAVFRARAQSLSGDGSVLYETEIWKCFEALAKTSYPPRWKVEPLGQLDGGWPLRVQKNKYSAKELVAQLADAWIRDPDAREDERRMRWHWLSWSFGGFPIEYQTLFHETCQAYEQADSWLLNLLSGVYHIDLGWHHRGTGYADTVSEAAAWQFQNNLRIAGDRLQLAWQLDPKLPEPAAYSITTAMAGEQATAAARTWFDRAVAAQMDYEDAYSRYLYSLRPRWGGSFEKLYAFGQECLATKRFDTVVPRYFVDAVYDINDDVDGHYTVFRDEQIWLEVCQVYAGLINESERAPNDNSPAALATQWLLYAIHSEHFDDACTAFKFIELRGWSLDVRQHNFLRIREATARSIVAGVGGPGAAAARKALPYLLPLKRLEPKDRDECLAALDELLEKDPAETVHSFFGHWRQTLTWEKAYDAGGWVDLTFEPKLTGWVPRRGEWERQPDGSAVARRKDPDHLNVEAFCNARFLGAYEVRAKLSLPQGCKRPVAPGISVFVEFGVQADEPSEERRFWITPLQGRAGVTDYGEGFLGRQTTLSLTEPNEMRLLVWPNEHQFDVNGSTIAFEQKTPDLPRQRIALVSAFHLDPKAPVRFSDVRVRKLNREPPPPETDFDARLVYYTQCLEDDPDDVMALAKRSWAYRGKKQNEEAIRDLDRALQLQPNAADLHVFRGMAAQVSSNYGRAVSEYETAAELNSQLVAAWRELAWTCATCNDEKFRDGAKAVAAGKRACEIMKMKDYGSLIVLSAAYAEVGEHDQAIAMAKRALPLAAQQRREWTKDFIARRQARMPERDAP